MSGSATGELSLSKCRQHGRGVSPQQGTGLIVVVSASSCMQTQPAARTAVSGDSKSRNIQNMPVILEYTISRDVEFTRLFNDQYEARSLLVLSRLS